MGTRQAVLVSVHSLSDARLGTDRGSALTDHDSDASDRLKEAITAAFGSPGKVRNWNQLANASGVSRSTTDGYTEKGVPPTRANMDRIAKALGVTAESLWLRWLGYDVPEPGLSRIADEISELRDALLDRATRRGTDAERRDWDAAQDRGRRAGDVPPDEPDKPPA